MKKKTKEEKLTYKRVFIKWLDSTSRKSVWWSAKGIIEDIEESEKGDYFYSTGYLFKTTQKNYYLANSLHFEDGQVVSFGSIFSIPKGCVVKITKA